MKVTMVGGGSASWTPILLQSFMLNPALEGAELCLYDIDPNALRDSAWLCSRYIEKRPECRIQITQSTELDSALKGAKYVIVAISHGGLDAELEDHRIARKYGLYNIKGSEVGIAGASRTIRMVPELVRIATHMKRICSDAIMLNVSNPLTSLTRSVRKYADVEAVGLCHGVINHLSILLPMIGAKRIDEVDFNVAGVDHDSWLLSVKYHGKDALEKIRSDGWIERARQNEKIGEFDDPFAGRENQRLRFLLWDTFGYMPAISDEHCVEFFGQMIQTKERRDYFGMHYDRIVERTNTVEAAKASVAKQLCGETEIKIQPQGEIVDKLIAALEGYGPYTDIMNYRNVGQVSNLPLDSVVETRVYVDSCGFHPVHAGALPPQIEPIVRPVAVREELFMEAAMEQSFEKLRAALVMDPLEFDFRCIDAVCHDILDYNKQFIMDTSILKN